MLTPQNGSGFQSRASMGGDSTYTPTAPHWLKLVRSGNAFTGYTSDDGVGWSLAGSQSIPMSGSIVIGLAVTSRNNSALNTATFTGVLVDAPLLLMHSTGEGSPDQGENK